jgi:hypothetical protein
VTNTATANEAYAQSLFEDAENQRLHGSSLRASLLYREAIGISCPSTSLWLMALHMDAVCRRVRGSFQVSIVILDLLLGDPRAQVNHLLRAHLLRDKADALRKLKQLKDAYEIATESFELFVEHGGSLSQIGASRGFLARIAWDQGDQNAARAMSEEAALELQAGDDREVELYHLVFHARITAHYFPIDAPYFAACGLALCDEGYGKDAHRRQLEAIRDNANDVEALEKALAKLEQSSIT